MPDDLSKLTALVYDSGLYPWVAEKLAEKFGTTYYFTPYAADVFPVSRKISWGEGLPGVERVRDFFDYVDAADLIVFPDCGQGDMVTWLRQQGKRVWGAGAAEVLELDRVALLEVMQSHDLAMPDTEVVTGMDDLRAYLEDEANDDSYVQVSEVRGDMETHHHVNWWLSEGWWTRLNHQLGPMGRSIIFVVKKAINDAVESGIDDICIDGQFAPIAGYGYESKDRAYLGRVVPRADLPPSLSAIHDALSPFLKKFECRSMVQSEMRVTADGTAYLLDVALRQGSPPSEALYQLYDNWPEMLYAGAGGEVIAPEPLAQFYAELILKSDVAERDFLALRFPEESRPFIKLHGHAIIDDVDYAPSLGMDIVGAAVGIGDTRDDAIGQAIDVAKSIEAEGLTFDVSAFDQLRESIAEGTGRGIPWPVTR